MRLPIIKHVTSFVEENDEDWVNEAIELLEHYTEAPGLKDGEMDVLGEMLSNLYGAIEVHKDMKNGKPQKEALNDFMKRVTGSID
jgi:hypothetical protein